MVLSSGNSGNGFLIAAANVWIVNVRAGLSAGVGTISIPNDADGIIFESTAVDAVVQSSILSGNKGSGLVTHATNTTVISTVVGLDPTASIPMAKLWPWDGIFAWRGNPLKIRWIGESLLLLGKCY